ncbi:hypothetical protein RI129_002663 [Pyrocoelia pectoralis]|uniref:Tesmin/TSO1-like CXC domain-containing protein n=1 Tax=Pyrocoelia pectoralis TaxID=417401 RepID=A0AAN7VM46_9COLE
MYDEVHVVFDRYDVPKSLKGNTRQMRLLGTTPVAYNISDNMNINRLPMKKLLSHTSTKQKLARYLAQKLLKRAEEDGKKYVVAWDNLCLSSHNIPVEHLQSEQEEADTKLVLHAVHASKTASGVDIFTPDTDVLVLSIRRYKDLCENTNIVTGSAEKFRNIPLQPIFEALGPTLSAALPGFHCFTGSDTTGTFSGKGKASCWKLFCNASEDIISAFSNLGNGLLPSEEVLTGLEKFVCQLYISGTKLEKVQHARWLLFKMKQAEAESLSPTWHTLHEAILRAHYQCMIWQNDIVANPKLPSPEGYGWTEDELQWKPVMTKQQPAPSAIVHLVKCSCNKSKCSNMQCGCKKSGLNCTDLCSCSELEDACENAKMSVVEHDENEVDDTEF